MSKAQTNIWHGWHNIWVVGPGGGVLMFYMPSCWVVGLLSTHPREDAGSGAGGVLTCLLIAEAQTDNRKNVSGTIV